jgi:photosystem II stability/assembly factor-like uncharacterized protein
VVGLPGIIYHHNGSRWEKIKPIRNVPSLNSICFSDIKHGVAVGYKGAVMIYSDGKWIKGETPGGMKLNGIGFSENTYYAVGNSGYILTFTKKIEPIPEKNNLSSTRIQVRNYPNPAGDLLYYAVPDEFTGKSGRVIITNSVGQILYVRDVYDMHSGQTLNYGTANLSNGSYFIRIESSGLSGTGKFIVKH